MVQRLAGAAVQSPVGSSACHSVPKHTRALRIPQYVVWAVRFYAGETLCSGARGRSGAEPGGKPWCSRNAACAGACYAPRRRRDSGLHGGARLVAAARRLGNGGTSAALAGSSPPDKSKSQESRVKPVGGTNKTRLLFLPLELDTIHKIP